MKRVAAFRRASIGLTLRTYWQLGLVNIARVVVYSVLLRTGILRALLKPGKPITGEFLSAPTNNHRAHQAARLSHWKVTEQDSVFGHHSFPLDNPPEWHRSVLSDKTAEQVNRHWSVLSDFGSKAGDIKGIWEASRFGWLVPLAQNAMLDSNHDVLHVMNAWISDWSAANPENIGPNWKCAQEASLRLLHLAAAGMILGNHVPTTAARTFIEAHLKRILPTLSYAKAQDNNHGTSEAAALFIGASWLKCLEPDESRWQKLELKGRKYLQERVARLVMTDGSFSQYSVTYHRLLLDTLSLVELWCRFQNLPTFSLRYLERVGKAAGWLYAMVDDVTGDAPNLGANDGAHILNYFAVPYRDFRYSAELACLLFRRRCAFPGPISDTVRNRFYLTAVGNMERQEITRFDKGGYGLARLSDTWMLLRAPAFKFRPSNADVMHLDVWHQGINWLRDGGTFSYNTEPKWLDYFAGSRSHNVIEFDDHAQMPRLSRFLFGGWPQYEFLRTEKDETGALRLESACEFWHGGRHHRTAILTAKNIEVIDVVENFNDSVRVRWRLAPENWTVAENTVSCPQVEIKVSADLPVDEFTVTQGYESRYYGTKDPVPVLEVVVPANTINNAANTSKNTATITTIISWS